MTPDFAGYQTSLGLAHLPFFGWVSSPIPSRTLSSSPPHPHFLVFLLQLRLCPQCCVNPIIHSSLLGPVLQDDTWGNCITMADWFHYTFMNRSASVGQPLPLSRLLILRSTFSHFPSAAAPDLHSLHPTHHHYLPHSGAAGAQR